MSVIISKDKAEVKAKEAKTSEEKKPEKAKKS